MNPKLLQVLYRFTAFDPFERSSYFGRSLDLGQFERFRRIFHTPYYVVLLNHTERRILSSLQVSKSLYQLYVQGLAFCVAVPSTRF